MSRAGVRAVAGVVALALLAAACTGPRAKQAGPPDGAPAAAGTPTRAEPVLVDDTARTLRAAVAKSLRACPCTFHVTVVHSDSDAKYLLDGVYFPQSRSAVLGDSRGTQLRVIRGVTYYRGPHSGGEWARLDLSRVPQDLRAPTDLALLAGVDPVLLFAMAESVHTPRFVLAHDRVREFSVSYDVDAAAGAAGESGPLLRRLVGAPQPYGSFYLDDKDRTVDRFTYGLVAPGQPDLHGVSVLVRMGDHREPGVVAPVPPRGARDLTVT